ncbi:calmodulin-binding protein 60 A-like [Olea europaea var. sylvestris]|uniref:calmodulin-binding protein 60 A-like n=1 Tax=Olea europaea var. sylvestris TaxID=158386 RepID=UPI000C1D78F5|nr:calmodulin-binding protein 60 A-like [Olea europaea var. sylvestris]
MVWDDDVFVQIGKSDGGTAYFPLPWHCKAYKKHYPPFLFDEVWRLEKIGKDGAFHKCLSQERILGTGMSTKMWEVILSLLRTSNEGQYIPSDKLSETKKADAHNLVISAYRDREKVVTFDDEASLMDLVPRLSIEQSSSYLQLEGSSNGNKVLSSQNFNNFSYLQQNVSLPHIMQSKYSIRGLSNQDGYFHTWTNTFIVSTL